MHFTQFEFSLRLPSGSECLALSANFHEPSNHLKNSPKKCIHFFSHNAALSLCSKVIHPKAGVCVKLNSFYPAAAAAQSLMQFESLMRGEFSALPLSAKFTLPTKAAIRGNGIICTAAKLNTSRSTDCLLRLGTLDMQHIFFADLI